MECDASRIGIKAVLMQKGCPIAYLTKKLNGAAMNYSKFDKELYAFMRVFDTLWHYLWTKELMIHTDHKLLCILKTNVS